MKYTIAVTWEDDQGEEQTAELPAKYEVCSDCRGEGRTLIEGLRFHAFSREEFEEQFHDDEDREAYFDSRSHYHEACPTCGGKRVELVVDVGAISTKEQLAAFEHLKAQRRADREYVRLCQSEFERGC